MAKKNLPVIFGIAIPLVMVLIVAGTIYFPTLFVHPKYSFLYAGADSYYGYIAPYAVVNGQLTEKSIPTSTFPGETSPQLYVYDMTTRQSRSISFADAQKLSLDTDSQSPDGFQVVAGDNGGGFFPFYGVSDYGTYYLKGHNIGIKLDLPMYYQFIGWINQ